MNTVSINIEHKVPEYIMEEGLKLNLIDIFDLDGKSIQLKFIDLSEAIKTFKQWQKWEKADPKDRPKTIYNIVKKDEFQLLYVSNLNSNDYTHI